ncbi:MAG TPA: selenium metabolism-associated LysR family transcriptional regulator [Candidatus Eisenbacteria bacterium]|nr:selenium metabolism-associated LysR family transcriptional regulator [Candidatus Eisenbacteria bacterium]
MAKLKDDLDLRKLEVFYWVAELKSFSQAAEHLALRQPTVSAHVQELERTLGERLFYRIPGKVSLTPLGNLLLEKARALVTFKRDAIAALEQFHGKLSGELWIGGSNIPGEYLLPQKLGAFVKLNPEVKPILRIGDSTGIAEEVVDGKVELGFVGFKVKDERLRFRRLWRDDMVLVVPKGHRWSRRSSVSMDDLRLEPFISRERGSGTLASFRRVLSRNGRSTETPLNVAMELGSTEAVKEALIAGFGVSILSRTSVRREIAGGILVALPLRGYRLQRWFYEALHVRRPLSPIAEAFRKFLRKA